MKTKELIFGFGCTLPVDDRKYIKAFYQKGVDLEPQDKEEEAREELVQEVVDFVAEKLVELKEGLE